MEEEKKEGIGNYYLVIFLKDNENSPYGPLNSILASGQLLKYINCKAKFFPH